jgi:hypothetical protein
MGVCQLSLPVSLTTPVHGARLLVSGTDLGVAHARTGIAAGFAVVVGPLVASVLASRYGNRSVYLLAAGGFCSHCRDHPPLITTTYPPLTTTATATNTITTTPPMDAVVLS